MPNEAFFSSKFQTFGLGQTIWGILGIFEQSISTHLGTVIPCFPLINHYFYKNT
jgi:hypothetical protein